MVNETILAVIIAFVISAILCPIVIPFLHKLKFGQQVRDDGPQAHLKKQGTPTMGGLVILSSIIITSLLYLKDYPKIIPVLFVTAGFGVIGFLDDYIKIVMKRSEGLNPGQKLAGQIIITGIFAYYIITSDRNADAYSVHGAIPGYAGLAFCSGTFLYRSGNRQRCEFYRRP